MLTMDICPLQKKCGGCQYQGIPYEKQLKKKEDWVRNLMGDFCEVYPITGMENPYFYRNKVHAVVSQDKKGNIITGVYQEGTHRVVPVESCMIEDELADRMLRGEIKKGDNILVDCKDGKLIFMTKKVNE